MYRFGGITEAEAMQYGTKMKEDFQVKWILLLAGKKQSEREIGSKAKTSLKVRL